MAIPIVPVLSHASYAVVSVVPAAVQMALATMFTVSATTPMLKKNATSEWTVTVRRIRLLSICTSET
jgi:hypothetical protein